MKEILGRGTRRKRANGLNPNGWIRSFYNAGLRKSDIFGKLEEIHPEAEGMSLPLAYCSFPEECERLKEEAKECQTRIAIGCKNGIRE